MGPQPQDLVGDLAKIGLTKSQARVYLSLLSIGEGSAVDVARTCSMDVATARRRMKELAALHLVEVELGRPNLFVPADTKPALLGLLSDAKAQLDSKLRIVDEVTTETARLRPVPSESLPKSKHGICYRLVTGRSKFISETTRILGSAEREASGLVPPRALVSISGDLHSDAVKGNFRKGIVSRFITEVNDSNLGAARSLAPYAHIRSHRCLPFEMHIKDRKVVTIGACRESAGGPDATDSDPYLVVEDQRFAEAMSSVFDALWEDSFEVDLQNYQPTSAVVPADKPQVGSVQLL
ncbi:MAG TPA: helix-turn-helix domain-containing protein [Conexivisphaerales archaeon]|nr:helix-turn-helix domain-containing protein [Conexivisphaerales archaeon]